MEGSAVMVTVGAALVTEQLWNTYEPLSVPLVHVRVWETQVEGDVTEDDWYAVTEEPSLMVPPHGRLQGAAVTLTVTDWSGDVPPGPVHWKVKVVFE